MLGEILALAMSMQNSAIGFDGPHPGFSMEIIPWELRISSKPRNDVIFIYISKLLSNHAQEFLPSVLMHDKTNLSINITEGPEEDVFISQIVSSI